ncbi:MAG: CCA tRNA nucleotidyltransferase [Blastocatellia bacterium]
MIVESEIAAPVRDLCLAVDQLGGRALLAGGWVRDMLRRQASADYDIEVYGLAPARLRVLLERTGTVNLVGESFTVYKFRPHGLPDVSPEADRDHSPYIDVSLPRRESRTGRGHRAFAVTGDPDMSFAEAARRRDFTINAIMFDPLTSEIIDPYQGVEDIRRGVIRVVDPRTFVEDSLRVLRGMQFASRFAYELDEATVALCRTIDLSDLPAERILAEVEKWLLKSARPSVGWWAARRLGIVEKLWPEARALIACPQDPEWHPEGDVWIHTGLVLDEARKLIGGLPRAKQMAVMLGALCHDFGKPPTTAVEDGRIRSKGHEDAGVAPTHTFLDRLNVQTMDGYDVRAQVAALVQYHLSPGHFHKAAMRGENVSDGAFRRLAQKLEPDLLYRVARADCLGRTGDFPPTAMEWFRERVAALAIEHAAPAPLLLGRHVLALGIAPGPRVGQITREVYEWQLDGRVGTLDEAINAAMEIIARA